MTDVRPGDVLTVHDASFWGEVIRLGPAVHDLLLHDSQPVHWNHVLVVMPDDAKGNRWGIEGRPGGVGWRDLTASGYLDSTLTLSNATQPKTDAQRAAVCQVMEAMAQRHTAYDWGAIAASVAREIDPLWGQTKRWGAGVPGHVICSSAADYAYHAVGLPNPGPDQFCTPWDWATFDMRQGWK